MPDEDLIDLVKRFVATKTAKPLEEIQFKTLLSEDLGLDFDRFYEFMEAFTNEFQIDRSSFESLRIPNEPFTPMSCFGRILFCLYVLFWILLVYKGSSSIFIGCFGGVGIAIGTFVMYAILFEGFNNSCQIDHYSLTVGDLVEVAHAKRWVFKR
jgi:hypothetical protein